MFGFSHSGVKEYSRVGLETGVVAANPHTLIIMLYEGAISTCNTAIGYMGNQDIVNKSASISKAITIIESGLRLSLDKKSGGEIALSLDALYAYMSDRLYAANIKNQPEPIREVIKLLQDLKGAWEGIGSQAMASGVHQ